MTAGAPPGVFVHDAGLCEATDIGPGTRIWAFAHVLAGARIGADCNVGDHAYIEDGAVLGDRVVVKNGVSVWAGVTLEDDVFAGPNVAFTNDLVPRAAPHRTAPEDYRPTLVRHGASLGANATLVCGVTVGEQALVGAGAVVVEDVPAHAIVVGSPARVVGWVCHCGGRIDADSLICAACGTQFGRGEPGGGLSPAR